MTFTAILVDDEPLAIEALDGLCARDERVEIIGTAHDGATALTLINEVHPDAVFLDIGMPRMNGLDLADALRELDNPPLVVFVTAYDHYASEAFDLAVADYILKPLKSDRLSRAIDRIAAAIAERHTEKIALADDLWLPSRGTMVRVPITDITRIEADRDYARVWTRTESYLMRATMASIEVRLAPDSLIRIHRSTIVARETVSGCRHLGNGAWAIVDHNGERFAIGRQYLASVRQSLGLTNENGKASLPPPLPNREVLPD